MRWTDSGRSSNIEDRRGGGGGFGGFGGGGGGFGRGMGLGGTAIVLILSLLFGRNLFTGGSTTQSGGELAPADSTAEEPEVHFVSFVLDDAQRTWAQILPQAYGTQYHDARLVLFRDQTPTGCGTGETAMGPFYCPVDQKVYIDLAFYDELKRRFGASGDFAQAYVIAHELGHHVQRILGTDAQVRRAQQQNPDAANQLSVRLELQADCYAGVWGHSTQQRNILEQGDVEEGLNAAASVGDDRIQQQTTGHVDADSFTHGSSAQRTSWFKRGFDSGDPKVCDTFADVGGR